MGPDEIIFSGLPSFTDMLPKPGFREGPLKKQAPCH